MRRVFFPCSLLYLLLGIDVEPSSDDNGEISVWRRLRQLFLAPLAWIYFPSSYFYAEFDVNYFITNLSNAGYLVLNCVFQVTHLVRGREIRAFVKRLNANSSHRLCCTLLVLSCIFILIYMAHVAISAAMIVQVYKKYESITCYKVALMITSAFLENIFYDIDVMSMSIYFAALLLYYNTVRVKTSYLLQFIHYHDERVILNTLNDIRRDYCQFESLFNYNPLMWLVRGLCLAVITLMFPTNVQLNLFLAIRQFCLIGALLFTHFVREKITSLGDQLLDAYSETTFKKKGVCCHLCRSIDRAYNNHFTVWQMFVIDRSLIASYIGAVVTFTVLFVQVQHGALVNTK